MTRTVIPVPRLAVIRSNNIKALYDAQRCVKEEPETTFLYRAKDGSDFMVYKMFSKLGGKLTLADTDYINQKEIPGRPKVRLLIVIPSDVEDSLISLSLIRAVKIAAVVSQTVIGIEMVKFKKRMKSGDYGKTITFEFASTWDSAVARVPDEMRTYSGGSSVFLSEPMADDSDLTLPRHGILKVNKSSAELYGDPHVARFLKKCLELLGVRSPDKVLHLSFILPLNLDFYGKDQYQTFRDVSVIKSKLIPFLPSFVSGLYSSFTSLKIIKDVAWRSLPRVIKQVEGGSLYVNHTLGGAVASFYGAVLHELGHLFKLPHSANGVMAYGGDNIQKHFILDRLVNFAIPSYQVNSLKFGSKDYLVVTNLNIKEQLMEDMFDSLSIHLLYYSTFINWREGTFYSPITVNFQYRIASSIAGIRFVLYNEDSEDSPLKYVASFDCKKVVKLQSFDTSMRILIVASDGNFLSVVA